MSTSITRALPVSRTDAIARQAVVEPACAVKYWFGPATSIGVAALYFVWILYTLSGCCIVCVSKYLILAYATHTGLSRSLARCLPCLLICTLPRVLAAPASFYFSALRAWQNVYVFCMLHFGDTCSRFVLLLATPFQRW